MIFFFQWKDLDTDLYAFIARSTISFNEKLNKHLTLPDILPETNYLASGKAGAFASNLASVSVVNVLVKAHGKLGFLPPQSFDGDIKRRDGLYYNDEAITDKFWKVSPSWLLFLDYACTPVLQGTSTTGLSGDVQVAGKFKSVSLTHRDIIKCLYLHHAYPRVVQCSWELLSRPNSLLFILPPCLLFLPGPSVQSYSLRTELLGALAASILVEWSWPCAWSASTVPTLPRQQLP